MKSLCMLLVTSLFLALPAMADHPAVGYWLIESAKLTNAVNSAGSLDKVKESDLDDMAECRGTFKGNCDVWLLARTAIQFRLKADDDGKSISYSVKVSYPMVKVSPKDSEGKLEVGSVPSAKEGWEKDKYVLVMQRLNLKL